MHLRDECPKLALKTSRAHVQDTHKARNTLKKGHVTKQNQNSPAPGLSGEAAEGETPGLNGQEAHLLILKQRPEEQASSLAHLGLVGTLLTLPLPCSSQGTSAILPPRTFSLSFSLFFPRRCHLYAPPLFPSNQQAPSSFFLS